MVWVFGKTGGMNIMENGFTSYPVIDAVDLRAFDSRMPDYGISRYIDMLGFRPQVITLLENSIEQLHSNDGKINNDLLPYLWCAERGMPGGTVWSKRQLYGLVEAAHEQGIQFYMGSLCVPNKFPEYGSRAEWLYEHADVFDLFVTLRDGSSLKEVNGEINPLRRLPDGRWYEDVFIEDLIRYLNDYHMDGFFAGDGWCGLAVTLAEGDFHEDMIAQFEEWSGVRAEGSSTCEKADFIWENPKNRALWIKFYAARWARFYKKLYTALKEAGKELASLDPWARGPVDALYDYGIDYGEMAKIGYSGLCLQAREENWGRNNGDWMYSWESGARISIPAIRAMAPDLKLFWATCICNAPEHWIATKDARNVLERQSFSLPTLTYLDKGGEWKRALEGLLFIFGTDSDRGDWDFFRERWDFAFGLPIQKTYGPALVYSDKIHRAHLDQGKRWQLTASPMNLVICGLPLHSAVNMEDLGNAGADAYLLVDPLGISDEEVYALMRKREEGAGVIVIGETDHPLLERMLGIKNADVLEGTALRDHRDGRTLSGYCRELDIADTRTDGAESMIDIVCGEETRTLVSVDRGQKGPAVFIRRMHEWKKDQKTGRYFEDQREFIAGQPDAVDRMISELLCGLCGFVVHSDAGQLFAHEVEDGIHIGVENAATCLYSKITLSFPEEVKRYSDYSLQRYTPAGYIHFDPTPKHLSITVPPDNAIQVKVELEGNRNE